MEFASFKKLINPDKKPYLLAGFGSNRQSGETCFGIPELYIKICWIKEETSSMVFITLDTLYFSKEFTSAMSSFVSQKYQVEIDQIIFNASHTHSAPNISMPLWSELNNEYREKVESAFYEGIDYCAHHLHTGYLDFEFITPPAKVFINRRKKTVTPTSLFKKKVVRLPNYVAPIDENIRLIKIYNTKKEPEVILYNFSCHPVFNRNDEYSSDFIGDLSKKLESHVKTALFLQGFCGDTRANYSGKLTAKTVIGLLSDFAYFRRNVKLLLKLLLYGEIFIPYTKEYYNSFVNTLYSLIKKNISKPLGSEQSPDSAHLIKNNSFIFTMHSETQKTYKQFRTSIISLGTGIFVSIPAEVNSCYHHMIAKWSGNNLFFPLGYGYDMIGYLPCAEEIADGGYEVDSFRQYDFDSHLNKQDLINYKDQLEKSIKELLKK